MALAEICLEPEEKQNSGEESQNSGEETFEIVVMLESVVRFESEERTEAVLERFEHEWG